MSATNHPLVASMRQDYETRISMLTLKIRQLENALKVTSSASSPSAAPPPPQSAHAMRQLEEQLHEAQRANAQLNERMERSRNENNQLARLAAMHQEQCQMLRQELAAKSGTNKQTMVDLNHQLAAAQQSAQDNARRADLSDQALKRLIVQNESYKRQTDRIKALVMQLRQVSLVSAVNAGLDSILDELNSSGSIIEATPKLSALSSPSESASIISGRSGASRHRPAPPPPVSGASNNVHSPPSHHQLHQPHQQPHQQQHLISPPQPPQRPQRQAPLPPTQQMISPPTTAVDPESEMMAMLSRLNGTISPFPGARRSAGTFSQSRSPSMPPAAHYLSNTQSISADNWSVLGGAGSISGGLRSGPQTPAMMTNPSVFLSSPGTSIVDAAREEIGTDSLLVLSPEQLRDYLELYTENIATQVQNVLMAAVETNPDPASLLDTLRELHSAVAHIIQTSRPTIRSASSSSDPTQSLGSLNGASAAAASACLQPLTDVENVHSELVSVINELRRAARLGGPVQPENALLAAVTPQLAPNASNGATVDGSGAGAGGGGAGNYAGFEASSIEQNLRLLVANNRDVQGLVARSAFRDRMSTTSINIDKAIKALSGALDAFDSL
ncbi:hypothetical protein GQ42DRAFT_165299 [Ramicandelaber brevisporus]|nr:hypothetical protein GQ42DRAFT_165299 [Ramicandelaber brevisporus]